MPVKEHLKEHRPVYIATLIISAIFGGGGSAGVGLLIDYKISEHSGSPHQVSEQKFGQIKGQLDGIEAMLIARDIREVMYWQCDNAGDRSRDNELERLQQDYRSLTGIRYPRVDC